MQLSLSKPLILFDIESTGLQIGSDCIIELSLIKVFPDGKEESTTHRFRPLNTDGTPKHIPEDSTLIHHITDEDVKDKPTFKEMAPELFDYFGDADLAGYNSNKFDVPMLVEEFHRAGFDFSLSVRRLVDVQNIFHKMEQRTLIAAYKFYCHDDFSKHAHSADADVRATYEVLKAQLDYYKDTPYTDYEGNTSIPVVNDIEQLSRFTCDQRQADISGFIGFDAQHKEVFKFGKHKGETVESVFLKEPSYYSWMMNSDFPFTTKQVITDINERIKPLRKGTTPQAGQHFQAPDRRQNTSRENHPVRHFTDEDLKNHFGSK